MNPLKRLIVDDLVHQVGSPDQAGIAAISMELLHPSVMAGVGQQSNYREQPFRRARTTYGWVITNTFGSTAAAERMIERVRRMHARVTGTRPDGVPYRALEPELIAWVHSSIPWTIMHAYERFNRSLTSGEKDRYLAEQSVIALMSGADEAPTTVAEMEAFIGEMRPKLAYTEMLGEFFDFLETGPLGALLPPRPLARPVQRFQVASGMSLAPRWAQEMTGYDRPAAVQRYLYEPSMHAYARALRWAFGKPPWRRLAEERVGIDAGAPSTTTPRIGTPVSA